MFAGETQADVLMETYLTIPAGVLIATGLVKAMLTPALINMGWRGGHFFPVIFSGVSLGYGLAILTGADPVFCVAVCTASTMGAVMRQPVMVVGLLLMCFPLKGIVCMITPPSSLPVFRCPSRCASSTVAHAGDMPFVTDLRGGAAIASFVD